MPDFNKMQRERLAARNQAMPNGGFPIRNVSDLKNAIQAYGRAKNKPAVKAWIKKRAKALGREDLLPENWRTSDTIVHYGIKGQKWGVRRYQNEDGSLTPAGERRANKALKQAQKSAENENVPGRSKGSSGKNYDEAEREIIAERDRIVAKYNKQFREIDEKDYSDSDDPEFDRYLDFEKLDLKYRDEIDKARKWADQKLFAAQFKDIGMDDEQSQKAAEWLRKRRASSPNRQRFSGPRYAD